MKQDDDGDEVRDAGENAADGDAGDMAQKNRHHGTLSSTDIATTGLGHIQGAPATQAGSTASPPESMPVPMGSTVASKSVPEIRMEQDDDGDEVRDTIVAFLSLSVTLFIYPQWAHTPPHTTRVTHFPTHLRPQLPPPRSH